MIEQIIKERQYLKGVSAQPIVWYKDSFHGFPVLNRPAISDSTVSTAGEFAAGGVGLAKSTEGGL